MLCIIYHIVILFMTESDLSVEQNRNFKTEAMVKNHFEHHEQESTPF